MVKVSRIRLEIAGNNGYKEELELTGEFDLSGHLVGFSDGKPEIVSIEESSDLAEIKMVHGIGFSLVSTRDLYDHSTPYGTMLGVEKTRGTKIVNES